MKSNKMPLSEIYYLLIGEADNGQHFNNYITEDNWLKLTWGYLNVSHVKSNHHPILVKKYNKQISS